MIYKMNKIMIILQKIKIFHKFNKYKIRILLKEIPKIMISKNIQKKTLRNKQEHKNNKRNNKLIDNHSLINNSLMVNQILMSKEIVMDNQVHMDSNIKMNSNLEDLDLKMNHMEGEDIEEIEDIKNIEEIDGKIRNIINMEGQ